MSIIQNTVADFWKNVSKKGSDDCWEWLIAKSNGYGVFHIGNKQVRAHRFSWEIHNGTIPDDLMVLHRCDNPGCVNPNHLFLGTHKDNMIDRKQKGRYNFPNGEDHHLYGKNRSEESKKKQGQTLTGEGNHRFGVSLTAETKEKIRASLTGKKRSEESKEKQRQTYKDLVRVYREDGTYYWAKRGTVKC